jgi:putative hemolysin
VFIEELGGDGTLVDHDARIEADRFDPFFDHLLLRDRRRAAGTDVVGVYRLMRADQAGGGAVLFRGRIRPWPAARLGAAAAGTGRSCLHRDYRGGTAMMHLWNGLADYIAAHRIEVMFGVASFHGTDPRASRGPCRSCITAISRRRTCAPPRGPRGFRRWT